MYYILDENNKPVPSTIEKYCEWIEENPTKKALKQEAIGDTYISTVFLGLDQAWNSNIPVLWETMIFGGDHDQYQERYTSVEDAIKGHEYAVSLAKDLGASRDESVECVEKLLELVIKKK
jgi:ABC-type uncharacterized transport system YnjBCD substrate-binding protein